MDGFQPDGITFGEAPENSTDNSLPGIDPNDITIGIELEMAIYGLPKDIARGGSVPLPGNAKQMLKDCLKGIEAKLTAPNNVFYIKGDPSVIVFPDEESSDAAVAEVVTPILSNGDWKWVIPEMCTAINNVVTGYGAHFDFSPRSQCSVHVHVGVRGRHYTLGELKQIAKAVVIFETGMDYHHPVHRRTERAPATMLYIESNRASPLLKGLSVAQMVDKITKITGSRELIYTMNGFLGNPTIRDRYYKYNFCATTKFGTVEFRQADGSIDGNWISAWAQNVIKFVTSAVSIDDENFQSLADLADEGYVWDDAIGTLFGLPPAEMQGAPLRVRAAPAKVLEDIVVPQGGGGLIDTDVITAALGEAAFGAESDDESDGDYGDDSTNVPRRRKRDFLKRINGRVRRALSLIKERGLRRGRA